MENWWQFGEHSGFQGKELDLIRIQCPYCLQNGNFSLEHHAEKRNLQNKVLNFDIYSCNNCSNITMLFWAAAISPAPVYGLHNWISLPYPLKIIDWPESWPEDIGRHWVQAKNALNQGYLDAASSSTRTALQLVMRYKGCEGSNLKQEIDYLANKGELPPLMKQWATEIRLLGNVTLHPEPGDPAPKLEDVRDALMFLDFLLEYCFSLPDKIEKYRYRQTTPM
jgi:hypothetical protein